MEFRLSVKTTIVTLGLACAMVSASVWQWGRHLEKQQLIHRLQETLTLEPIPLTTLINSGTQWDTLTFRRVKVSGTYDFSHEVILRNRNLEGRSGGHAITPLKVDSSNAYILVDRGFIPIGKEGRETRTAYQKPLHADLFGLVKQSSYRKFMAPRDPLAGEGLPWVDQWLRVDIPLIQKQLPYQVLPIFIEVMEDPNDPLLPSKIVREGTAGRNDVLMYTGQSVRNFGMDAPESAYPIPSYDITPPPDIHLGYVYEWAFMAILTIGIGIVMQLKRPAKLRADGLVGEETELNKP